MKTRWSAVLLIFLLVFASMLSMATAAEIKVVVDGNELEFLVPPTIINSKTMVPMREIFEALGAEVEWNGATKTVIGRKDGTEVKLTLGEKYAYKNGERLALQVAAQLVNGKTMVPIRFISESLGAKVDWDGATKTVIITSHKTVPNDGKDDADDEPSLLTVHFIDVGQGDAIFVDFGDYDILIDAGNNSYGQEVVNYLTLMNTDDIEILIATHPHADHIGGLDDVLAAFDVELIIDSGALSESKTFEDYMAAVEAEKDSGAELIYDDDMTFTIGDGIVFEVIETGDDYDNTNNNSVLCKLDYNDIEFLFTGDMESDVERLILDRDIQAEILKVGHHGSHTASCEAFLDLVQPEVAVISAGEGNSYGHPHEETLSRLFEHDIEVYTTSELGTIIVTTDGTSYSLNVTPLDDEIAGDSNQEPAHPDEEYKVVIESIDLSGEVVVIRNKGDKDVDMTGWYLISVEGNQRFNFPAGFVLKSGTTVEIRSGRNALGDGEKALVWTKSYIWNNDGDSGELYNEAGNLISISPK